jgi:hypothetical protein
MPKQSFHQAAPARQPVSKQPIREQDDLGEPQPIGKATYDYQAIIREVLASGGDVSICSLRDSSREVGGRACAGCGARLPKNTSITRCPSCSPEVTAARSECSETKNSSTKRSPK